MQSCGYTHLSTDFEKRLSCLERRVDDLQHGQDSQRTAIQDLQSGQDSLSQRMDRVETQSRGW